MAGLTQLLRYLERDDVEEIILQTGKAVTARVAGQLRPLGALPVSAPQMEAILAQPELQLLEGSGRPEQVTAEGVGLLVTLLRRGDLVMLRLARDPAATARQLAAAPPRAAYRSPVPPPSAPRAPIEVPPPEPPPHALAPRAPVEVPPPEPPPHALAPRAPVEVPPPAPTATLATPAPRAPVEVPPPAPPPQQGHGGHAAPLASEPAPDSSLSLAELHARLPWAPTAFVPTFAPRMLALFQEARQRAASDLHVFAGRPPMARLVGEMTPLGDALSPDEVESLLLPLLDARSLRQLRELGYADLAFDVPGAGRIRANVNRQKTGLKGCFRLVIARPPTLEELGLPPELAKVTTYHQGLAIVSGPNGHGKTTTMAALVDLLNTKKSDHIITVEDPVEIVHPIKKSIVSQRQVGAHTNSFASALKGALREDPDVIVIGELRDVETVEMALSAAETGHLVIATMSTPSGAKTIDRLIDMFPPEDQAQVRATLAGALKIIVSQRLIPSADGTRLVAAAELITGNFPLWNLIRDDKLYQLPSLLQRGRAFGMIRIEDSLRALIESRTITLEAALRVASDPKALQAALAAAPGAPAAPARPGARPPLGKGG